MREATDSTIDNSAHSGHAVYEPWVLALYDFWVLGVSNRYAWRCPTARLLRLYDSYLSDNHLEIGVGTGYYLKHSRSSAGRLCLMDLNPNALEYASRRATRFETRTRIADALQPFDFGNERFSSVGLNYLLHCLPGNMSTKGAVFRHVHDALCPGGVVFGATILGEGVQHNAFGRKLMSIYNRKGIFSNRSDNVENLARELKATFADFTLEVEGTVAIFTATR